MISYDSCSLIYMTQILRRDLVSARNKTFKMESSMVSKIVENERVLRLRAYTLVAKQGGESAFFRTLVLSREAREERPSRRHAF